jgi:hypothetical protein
MRSLRIVLVAFLLLTIGAFGAVLYTRQARGPAEKEEYPIAAIPSSTMLDEAQREYIWQVEHHTLVLGKYWFHDLADALAHSDLKALTSFMSNDFRGQTLYKPLEERFDSKYVHVMRYREGPYARRSVDQADLVNQLLEYRRQFYSQPKIKIYAKNLKAQDRQDLNKPWEGLGVLRMWGEVAPGQPGEIVAYFEFALRRPTKNKEKRWLQFFALVQLQTSRADRFFLRDVTRDRRIDPALYYDNWNEDNKMPATGGVYACDFNRDGIIDVLVYDVRRVALYQGQRDGTFREVTKDVGLPQDSPSQVGCHYAAFVDVDGDGWEDLIMTDRAYRNERGRRFVDYTSKMNLPIPLDGTGMVVADYDRDGKIDIYITMPGEPTAGSWVEGTGSSRGNVLWRNLGNWKFEDVTVASGTAAGRRSVFSAVWFDANEDGWPDIYVPNEFGDGVLLLNQGNGTFREHNLYDQPRDFGSMGITAGDVDNDGHIDLYVANMYSKTGSRIIGNLMPGSYPEPIMAKIRRFTTGSQLHLNRGQLRFEPVAEAYQVNDVGWAFGPALLDLDNDGWLDLYATTGYISRSRDEPDG